MRVISGKAGGTTLETIPGDDTRPTTDRVKESLFNMIQFEIKNKRVLDLFAGSGALGIESASRGAKDVVLVENNRACKNIINENIDNSNLNNIKLYMKDSFDYLEKNVENFDIVFLDPPYFENLEKKAIEKILEKGILNLNGLVIVEKDKKDKTKLEFDGLEVIKEKKYGRTIIVIFRRIK